MNYHEKVMFIHVHELVIYTVSITKSTDKMLKIMLELRGVENRRNIFLCTLQVCFVCLYYSETKNKVGKERRQAYSFSSRMICSVVHGAKGGKGKKEGRRQEMELQVNPFPLFTHLS